MKMWNKKIKFWPAFWNKLYFRSLLNSFPWYQPVWKNGRLINNSTRDCFDRFNFIEKEIKENNVKTLIDLGSAEGFYCFEAAKKCGVLALGADADERRIALAQMQLINEKIENVGFVYAEINKELIEKLPNVDCILFMSVAHHMIASEGQEKTLELLSEIRKKTNKFLIFEMGQSDEVGNKWTKDLPDMGPNPYEWVKNFLLSAGFSKVEKLTETPGYHKNTKRALFKALP